MEKSVLAHRGNNKGTYTNWLAKYKYLYIMLIPLLLFYLFFCYFPMYGVILAFKEYRFDLDIMSSPWVGFAHFKTMFADKEFLSAVKNTLIISFGKLLFNFPVPIILALLLNELRMKHLKNTFQTIYTFPHFVSWIIMAGILGNIFSSSGAYNSFMSIFGIAASSPLTQPEVFRGMLYATNAWKEMGWDTIIYMAALAGVNPEQYEAAEMDGANRFQKVLHVTWPVLRGTVGILLILAVGNIMNGASLDQVLNLYSAPVYQVGDIIDSYVYRASFGMGLNFGYTTAIGLAKSVVNIVVLCSANWAIKKFGGEGVY